jgi:hypothetical protein
VPPSAAAPCGRSLRRLAVAAALTLGMVAVPLASPAFAKDQPPPAGSKAAAPGGGRSAGQPDGLLQGGVSLGLSAPFGSFKTVAGRPADAPIGVPFQSLSRAGGALIRIDNQDVPRTSDPNNYAIAVLNRHSREVVESGIVNHGNTSMLGALATKYSGGHDFLMVVSSTKGVINDAANTNAFTDAVRQLGGRELTADELALLHAGGAFSVVGVPGGDPGGAYISIDRGAVPNGDVYGYLQVNVANNLYGVVTAEYPTFDTTNTSTVPGVASVTFDHKAYSSDPLPAGQSGFLLLSFDNALQVERQQTVVTNGTGNDIGAQFALPIALSFFTANTGKDYGTTVVVRSIGHPSGVGEGWSDAAKLLEKLGGNRLAFNSLGASGGPSEYSLVSNLVTPKAAVEGNPVLGSSGPVAGSLSRNREMVFTPVSGGNPRGINTELVDITYQAPQAFPAYTDGAQGTTTEGTAAADAYIGRRLGLCARAALQPVCSVRTEFYLNYGADFHQASIDLGSPDLNYPVDARGFTAADYEAVRKELRTELSMVNRVRTYFAGLQKPFGEAAQSGTIDTKALVDAVVAAVGPGPSATTSFVLGLIGKVVALGGFAGPPVSAVAAGMSAAFGLGAYLTTPTGPPQLASDVKVQADQLGARVRAQMLAASRSLNGTAMLMVSDYGKMRAVTERLSDEGWRLPNDTGPTLDAMSLAVRQSAAEKLVPMAYPWLLRGTPARSAQSMSCGYRTNPLQIVMDQVHIWGGQPLNASLFNAQDYFTPDGRVIPAPYWFARASVDRRDDDLTPSTALSDLLFKPAPADGTGGSMGLNLYSFLSPRVFGSIHQANDSAYHCDL